MRHLNTRQDATHLVEQLNELHIRGMLPEVLLQQPVDRALEEKRVVDRDEADALVNRFLNWIGEISDISLASLAQEAAGRDESRSWPYQYCTQ